MAMTANLVETVIRKIQLGSVIGTSTYSIPNAKTPADAFEAGKRHMPNGMIQKVAPDDELSGIWQFNWKMILAHDFGPYADDVLNEAFTQGRIKNEEFQKQQAEQEARLKEAGQTSDQSQEPSVIQAVGGRRSNAVRSTNNSLSVIDSNRGNGRAAAGSLQPKSLPSSVVAGTPSRNVNNRFDPDKDGKNGIAMTKLLQAMGKKGWPWERAAVCLKKMGFIQAESTIKAWVKRGERGEWGTPPKLTPKQWKTLEEASPKWKITKPRPKKTAKKGKK